MYIYWERRRYSKERKRESEYMKCVCMCVIQDSISLDSLDNESE